MLDSKFAVVAFFINLIGGSSYLLGTLHGRTKPNRVTWFLFMLLSGVVFFVQIINGVGAASLFTLSTFLVPALILAASFVNPQAEWKISRFDLGCGAFSLVGIALWLVTQEGDAAIAVMIVADIFAALPTVRKAWTSPHTENGFAFAMGVIAGILTLLTLDQWTFTNSAFTASVAILNAILTTFIYTKLGQRKPRQPTLHPAVAPDTEAPTPHTPQ